MDIVKVLDILNSSHIDPVKLHNAFNVQKKVNAKVRPSERSGALSLNIILISSHSILSLKKPLETLVPYQVTSEFGM